MSGSNVTWKAGDSRSIKLTKHITDEAYEVLNTKEMRVRSNRNKFITNAINSQTIIEFGTLEEKLRLIGVDDLSMINQLDPELIIVKEEDTDVHKSKESTGSNTLVNLFDSIPTK